MHSKNCTDSTDLLTPWQKLIGSFGPDELKLIGIKPASRHVCKQNIFAIWKPSEKYDIGWVYHHFSGIHVELGFQTTFRVIFADDKRKAVLIRGLEMPKKVRSDTFLSQKHVSVEMINAKLFWKVFISPTDLRKACALHDLCFTGQLRNATAEWQGLPLDSYSR